jgi:uncharacterized protein (DUF1778 family)
MLKDAARKARERIDVRLRPEQKSEIERAAHIKGLTVTWTLDRPDAEIFAAALAEPVMLGPQLALAAKRYRERFIEG